MLARAQRSSLISASVALLLPLLPGLLGCDPFPDAGDGPPNYPASADFGLVRGARLVADPGAEYVIDTEGLAEEADRAIELALAFWKAPPDLLEGWTIVFDGGYFVCGSGEGAPWANGCAYLKWRLIRVAPTLPPDRCRSGVLMHEVGHLVIGDREHRDPRWAQVAALETTPCQAP